MIILLLRSIRLLYYAFMFVHHQTHTHATTYDYDDTKYAIYFFSHQPRSETQAILQHQASRVQLQAPNMAEVTVATWGELSQTRHNTSSATRHRDWAHRLHTSPTPNYIMSDNKKQEKDYTKEVDALLPEAETIIKVLIMKLDIS